MIKNCLVAAKRHYRPSPGFRALEQLMVLHLVLYLWKVSLQIGGSTPYMNFMEKLIEVWRLYSQTTFVEKLITDWRLYTLHKLYGETHYRLEALHLT
ncbi:hypothetical protein PoB_006201100 [Plakobranchus ocellatus]|uniref:Uncharacterized protein n=1 Tax=Plakobranchus ocellatus TaxID=259542 RepID=A0AAV4CUZ6_9GAST|nr:hypothetical protein PoB_006201100 [Plakobranchus ocellatus]